jgi:hypothetical protein
MKTRSFSLAALLAVACAIPALAAPVAAQFGDPDDAAPATTVALANPEIYVLASGGVGDDERLAMESRMGHYSTRMVFSEDNGQYVVPDTLTVTKRGTEVMHVSSAGPLVYAQMPPGQYVIQATYKGVIRSKTINVTSRASDVHLTWPDSMD